MYTPNSKKKGFSEINVTPFVDVMLVLLVIFMVTAPMLVTGVQIELPEADAAPFSTQEEPITVTVMRDGSVYLNDTKADVSSLIEKLSAISEIKKDTKIFIRGDKSADYGLVMKVLATIQAGGFNKFSLITESESK